MSLPSRFPLLTTQASIILLILGMSTSLFAATAPVPRLPTINTVSRFYNLSGEQLREGYPVRIEGVVSYSDSAWRLFWLRDGTGTLFQFLPKGLEVPPARTKAIVTGSTTLVDGSPRIADLKVTAMGPGQLPPPITLTPAILNRGESVADRVMFGGTVAAVKRIDDERAMLIVTFMRSHQVQVTVRRASAESLERLFGAQIELQGHPSPLSEEPPPGVASLQVFVPEMSDVTVYRPGPSAPFEARSIRLDELGKEFRRMPDPQLVTMHGRVVQQIEPTLIELGEGDSRARVRLYEAVELKTNTLVQAVGVVRQDAEKKPFLSMARIRPFDGKVVDQPESEDGLPILRTVQSVRGLSPKQAAQNYSVDVHGTVTYYDRAWRVLFIQDATGGIYVDEKRKPLPVKLGDRVRVRGISAVGGYAPMISASNIEKEDSAQSTSTLPSPREIDFGRLLSGAEDSQWIRIKGTVTKAERSQRNLKLKLRHENGEFDAVVMGEGKSISKKWVGAEVDLTGVCGTRANAHRQATGILLHVPNLQKVRFLNLPPDDPFDIPTTPLAKLLRFAPSDTTIRDMIKIGGLVTFAGTTGLASVQDEDAATLIQFDTNAAPQIGDRIEVLGFAIAGGLSPAVSPSTWRKIGEDEQLPTFAPLEPQAALRGEQQAQLVSTEATIVETHIDSAIPTLTLRDRGVIFSADVSTIAKVDTLKGLKPGTVIRIAGVCSVQADEWNQPRAFKLLVPESTTLTIISQPPWLRPEHAAAAAGGLGVIVLIALGWIRTLRLRVARQTQRIRHDLEEKNRLTARFQELVQNAGDLVFTLDTEGRFVEVNPATASTLGSTREKLLRTRIHLHLNKESSELLRSTTARLNAENSSAQLELALKDERILETSVRLQTHESGPDDIQCIARNVSERRELEAQIRQMQKMESVGQLAAGVAHDYNNLMTVVLGNSQFILDDQLLSGDSAQMMSEIHEAAGRASNLTRQLLAFSRRQVMRLTQLDPGDLLRNLSDILNRLIGEDIDLDFDVPPELPTIKADTGMIEQAVINLVLNSRDAMSDGGKLTISAEQITISKSEAELKPEALPGPYVRISVTDTGTGIGPAELPRIFEPFYTTKDVGKGTGLGLSTVFGIAKQHEGWVEVETTVGVGTTFHLFVPSNLDETKDAALNPKREAPVKHGSETIMVVEDEDGVRRTMRNVLRRAGYRVIDSEDGAKALEDWASHAHEIDLLVTDLRMPGGISGRDLADRIREKRPDLLVVFCTGYAAELTGLSSLTSRERLLPKPFENKMLVTVVREILDTNRIASDA